MLLLQASEDEGYLLIWGEVSPETAKAALPFSPYDPGETVLAEILRPYASESLVGLAWKASAYLPTVEKRPLPSSPLLGETPSGAPTLAPWSVTALPFDAAEMIALLTACQEKEALAPGVRVGATLAYWAAVFRFATALTTRQQVVPDVVEDDGTYRARWKPVFVG